MTLDEFDNLLSQRIAKIDMVLGHKGKEYASDTDRLHNFKVAARIGVKETSPEDALLGMYRKHLVSVLDIIDTVTKGGVPSQEMLDEKIGDSINYLILLEALITERIQGYLETPEHHSV